MNVVIIDGNTYTVLMYVKNAYIIWANISSNVVDAGSRLATGAGGIGSDSINHSKAY